jgi:hypothetical protein
VFEFHVSKYFIYKENIKNNIISKDKFNRYHPNYKDVVIVVLTPSDRLITILDLPVKNL